MDIYTSVISYWGEDQQLMYNWKDGKPGMFNWQKTKIDNNQ